MADPFRTVDGEGRARFEVRGSGFLGHVRRAGSVEAAESFVERVRAEYDDATHNVPAYRVRVGDGGPGGGGLPVREHADDDGEPSGSAGDPALNVLQGQELLDVVAVVTRYYGGTNLGVGGLVSAYSRAVEDAVADAGVVERRPHERFVAAVDYDDSGTVRGVLAGADCEFDAEYAERVTFDVSAPVASAGDLRDRLRSATSGRVDIDG